MGVQPLRHGQLHARLALPRRCAPLALDLRLAAAHSRRLVLRVALRVLLLGTPAPLDVLLWVERPQPLNLEPFGTQTLRSSIKVSSTETGVIFGSIVYESARSDRNVIVLNDVHIDIMDYILPATCSDTAFRNMWAEFEWENKVAVNTNISDIRQYLDHIVDSTNMKCLTPPSALEGECGFLAANLYAKSVFGEDALVNVSIENVDGEIGGFIRIRSKTQGIALSLGDKITLKQNLEE